MRRQSTAAGIGVATGQIIQNRTDPRPIASGSAIFKAKDLRIDQGLRATVYRVRRFDALQMGDLKAEIGRLRKDSSSS